MTKWTKEYRTNYYRERKLRNKKFVQRYKLMKGCKVCGYKKIPEALHLDHIDPSKKDMTQKGTKTKTLHHGWSRKRIKDEMRKCQVLCARCHIEKTVRNNEWVRDRDER